jgi:hypothetical protein
MEPIRSASGWVVLFGILVAVTIGDGFLTWIDYRYSPLKIKAVKSSDDWRFITP